MGNSDLMYKKLLELKLSLLAKINNGTFVIHPLDVVEELNKILAIEGNK